MLAPPLGFSDWSIVLKLTLMSRAVKVEILDTASYKTQCSCVTRDTSATVIHVYIILYFICTFILYKLLAIWQLFLFGYFYYKPQIHNSMENAVKFNELRKSACWAETFFFKDHHLSAALLYSKKHFSSTYGCDGPCTACKSEHIHTQREREEIEQVWVCGLCFPFSTEVLFIASHIVFTIAAPHKASGAWLRDLSAVLHEY